MRKYIKIFSINEPAQEKRGSYGSSVCGTSNAHAQTPIGTADMRYLSEASSRSLLHVCKQQRLWRACAYAQARLRLCWPSMS